MWVLDDDLGRGERIRTSGLYVPNVALYQAKLHPEAEPVIVANLGWGFPGKTQIGSSRAKLLRTHSAVPDAVIFAINACTDCSPTILSRLLP